MNALLVALLLSQAADVPLAKFDEPLPRVDELQTGNMLPYDAICMDVATAKSNAKRIVSCEATVAKADEGFLISKPVFIGGIIGLVVVAFAAGTAVGMAAKK